jgi:ferritin-like metal-binding protein YciE
MEQLSNLEDVLINELRDLYNAESQLIKALPMMAKGASNTNLKEAFESHLSETREHVERLEKIGEILGAKLTGKTCKAMQGLVAEGEEAMKEESDNPTLIDALLIGAAQRVEHYEMAAYGTARAMAEVLQKPEIVNLLQETLDEESAADQTLTEISEDEVLPESYQAYETEGDTEDTDDDENESLGVHKDR